MTGKIERRVTIDNKAPWKDTDGNVIHAHGGHMLQENGYYYWFGENRTEHNKVSCYRSKDLVNWEHRKNVLTLDSPVKSIYYRTSLVLAPELTDDRGFGEGAIIERPKVLYNVAMGKYIMWMHWENGLNYTDARCAVASCDTVDGDYVYHGSFNPIGNMSRDCTLFQDDDGTAYFISAARDNADLLMYRLSPDYLSIEEQVKTLWPGQFREAPAVMKRHGVYFLISSACTGWLPNQGTYAVADSLTDRWSPLLPLGNSTTYDTQPAFIFPISSTGGEAGGYLYVGDRWDPSNYHASSYAFLPLTFPNDREMKLEWADKVTVDLENGSMTADAAPSGLYRLKSLETERYVDVSDESGASANVLSYDNKNQKWTMEGTPDGFVRFRNAALGRYLAVEADAFGDEIPVILAEIDSTGSCDWSLDQSEQGEEGAILIRNRITGKLLTASREEASRSVVLTVAAEKEYDPRKGRHKQWFELLNVYGSDNSY